MTAETAPAAGAAPKSTPIAVIVRARGGQLGQAEAQVVGAGGRLVRPLAIINGFSATVDSTVVGYLDRSPAIAEITPDVAVHLAGKKPGPMNQETSTGSLSSIETIVGAQQAWSQGITGTGVDVALLDSGVTPVAGLNDPTKVINGPDLSFDSQFPSLQYLDAYGHGTHMASIIAGRDGPAMGRNNSDGQGDSNDGSTGSTSFDGVAPDARIVNVKVGAANGVVDVSQVIAGMDWIVQHRTDNGMNIRVLNLSFGTDSNQPYTLDPLAFATEVAWRDGIVVVVAAGNGGNASAIQAPASDPFVLAVGAEDPNGQLDPKKGTVAAFSSAGTASRHVDVIAPGAHVLGLRDPGGYLDSAYAGAEVGSRYFLGSGTSQATAVVSGAVALLLQEFPTATPDQIKALLAATATPVNGASAQMQGAGVIQVGHALHTGKAIGSNAPNVTQLWTPSSGTGSLEASRGSNHVTNNGQALSGDQDIFSQPFNSSAMATSELAGSSWSGGNWNGSSWSGSSWSGSSWSGSSWSGSSWSGSSWSGSSWSGSSWSGSSWSGSSWSGSSWSGSSWSGSSWSGSCWVCVVLSPLAPAPEAKAGKDAVGASGDEWD
jgi:serine protease AprX